MQLQQHPFSTLSQAIASLEPTPINARTACGKPPQNTNSSDGAAPRNVEALSCPENSKHRDVHRSVTGLCKHDVSCRVWTNTNKFNHFVSLYGRVIEDDTYTRFDYDTESPSGIKWDEEYCLLQERCIFNRLMDFMKKAFLKVSGSCCRGINSGGVRVCVGFGGVNAPPAIEKP